MEGTVKWFSERKGYGFVEGEDGEDYFVHHTQIPDDEIFEEDDEVEFEPVETEKGLQAQDVQRIL